MTDLFTHLSSSTLEQVPPVLQLSEVHIWAIGLAAESGDSNRLPAWLSHEERERAARFHFQRDRQRWIAARASMRQILADYLGMPPQDLVFAQNSYGKPRIDPPPPDPLHFNLSHSRDLGLLGVARQEIGIDLEYLDPDCDWEPLAPTVFTQRELDELFYYPPAARRRMFFELWTRKEAYMKGRGLGMSLPPKSFSVATELTLQSGQIVPDQDCHDDRIWSLHSLIIAAAYPASLACTIDSPVLRYFTRHGSGIR